MSVIKFEQPVYKVHQPGYHPQRTIIVDEQAESPETLTIRLTLGLDGDGARNGGDLGGDCPPGLLPMAAYKSQAPQLHGFADSYSSHSTQAFSAPHADNDTSRANQLAFAANNAVASQYLSTQSQPLDVLSCRPTSGPCGTRVVLKAACQYELTGGPGASPFASVMFGAQRCQARVTKESRDSAGVCTYLITADAPPFPRTACPSLSNVPLTLLVESTNGELIARAANVATFAYHDEHSGDAGEGVAAAVPGDNSPPELGSPKTRSPATRESPHAPHQSSQLRVGTASPPSHHALATDPSTTDSYAYSTNNPTATLSSQAQGHVHPHSDFAAVTGAYGQSAGSMISTYRPSSYADHFSRAPAALRSPHSASAWSPLAGHLDSIRSPAASAISHVPHGGFSRSGLGPMQRPPTPALVRTSTLGQTTGSAGAGGYGGYGSFSAKATLNIVGDLGTMAENWTTEEWECRRRLVMFRKQQNGSIVTTHFRPTTPAEWNLNMTCVSCIWWEEKRECYITSVDTISLLEQLLVAPSRFGVEEKNRIRRNLEHFRPTTVSKAKAETEEFFKIIMSFPAPKPRNIEKDVKVFRWLDLNAALHKIISKYSAATTNLASPTMSSAHLGAPVTVGSSYAALPPTPSSASSTATTDALAASASYAHHHGDMPSLRPISGTSPSWTTAYGMPARTMSPGLRSSSPVPTTNMRGMATLPAVYDSRGTAPTLASPYGHHSHSGAYSQAAALPASSAHPKTWQTYSMGDGYSATQGAHHHSQVYGGGAYGDGTHRD